tara:strand:+ start:603 stop:1157 length:555 start_codon:yes stop_codon:yes gene_type:complete
MSSESNKLLCAILSAFLIYLLASFLSELIYKTEEKKEIKLSYYIEKPKVTDVNLNENIKKVKILKITEKELTQLLEKANLEKGKIFVNKNCASCHDFNMPIKNKIGPSLANVLNRKIGKVENYKYSKTLLNIDKEWNILNLYYFLEKPKEWAVGTKMSYRGISDSSKLLNTIKFLRENSLQNEN